MKFRLLPPFLCLLMLLPLGGAQLSAQHKVLVVGIDGCRPDALQAASTPVLDELMQQGTFSLDPLLASGNWNTVSAPGWMSALTGTHPSRHGITTNEPDSSLVPTLFELAETYRPELSTMAIWASPSLNWLSPHADVNYAVSTTDATLADDSVQMGGEFLLRQHNPDLLFCHFISVDKAGHLWGFGPEVPEYLASISRTDSRIGALLQAIRSRPTFQQEQWVVVVTTDHGGIGTTHFSCSLEERRGFVIFSELASSAAADCFSRGELAFEEREICRISTPTNSIRLNGQGQYLQCDAFGEEGYQQGITIECRLRLQKELLADYGGSTAFTIFDLNNANNPFRKRFVFYDLLSGHFKLFDWTPFESIPSAKSYLEDQWVHLALRIEPVENLGVSQLWINGELALEDTTTNAWIPNDASSILFGARQIMGDSLGHFMEGNLADVRIWNKALDGSLIRDWICRSPDSQHPDIAHLQLHWTFDSLHNGQVADVSMHGNEGLFVDAAEEGDNGDRGQQEEADPIEYHQPFTLTEELEDYSQVPRLVDLAPTVMDLLGIPAPAWIEYDGTSRTEHPACVIDQKQYHFSAGIDTQFTEIFRRYGPGWNAGDATISVLLPDGILWLFGDSYIGVADSSSNQMPCFFQVRNAAVLQQFSAPEELITLNSLDPPADFFQSNEEGTHFWPGIGIYADSAIFVFLNKRRGFELLGNFVATIDYPEMKVRKIDSLHVGKEIAWGKSLVRDEEAGYFYLYGNKGTGAYILRSLITNPFELEYYDGSGWVREETQAAAFSTFPVSSTYSLRKIKDWYYLFTQEPGFLTCGLGRNILAYRADSAAGPYELLDTIFTVEDRLGAEYVNTYNAYSHDFLPGILLFSYNVNDHPDVPSCPQQCALGAYRHPDSYRPKFFQLTYEELDPDLVTHRQAQTPPAVPALKLYPNPFTDELYIELDEAAGLELFNQMGQRVWQGQAPGGQGPLRMHLGQLPAGMYWLRVRGRHGELYPGRKLVKLR